MPLPKPKKGERTEDFIARGMSHPTMKREFPDTKQRLAVLYNILRQKRGESTVPQPDKNRRHCDYKREMYAAMCNLKKSLREDYDRVVPKPVGTVKVGNKTVGYYTPYESKLVYLALVAPSLGMAS